ncbi:MAG: type II toxin-antitoxin system PemK/MazF family toxin [Blastocatellia bacterium]
MTNYNFGDVILVPFPFTDQSSIKQRPAVVISNDAYHLAYIDIIVMAITSQPRANNIGEVFITKWKEANLLKPSVIKPVFTTLEKSLVIAKLGQLDNMDKQELRKTLHSVFG